MIAFCKKIIKRYGELLLLFLFSFSCKKFKGLAVPNAKIWLSSFRKRGVAFGDVYKMFNEFLKTDIDIVKKIDFNNNKNLIAICVIKNDLERAKKFLEHHRKLGIKQFVFLDDGSTDGTKEFLQSQNDVELFESKEPFITVRKEAWINRILAYYGFDRWYVVLDSDELLVYDNSEECKVDKFIALMEKENIAAVPGKMIDMYFYDGVEYFDKTGYFDFNNKASILKPIYTGGMRYRIFGMQIALNKTPLFFLDNKIIYHIHGLFPFEKNLQKKNTLALLHYKFLEGDLEEYRDRIKNKSMFNGSEEYKKYVEKMSKEQLSFYDENVSKKYESSKTLVEAGLLEKLEW